MAASGSEAISSSLLKLHVAVIKQGKTDFVYHIASAAVNRADFGLSNKDRTTS